MGFDICCLFTQPKKNEMKIEPSESMKRDGLKRAECRGNRSKECATMNTIPEGMLYNDRGLRLRTGSVAADSLEEFPANGLEGR